MSGMIQQIGTNTWSLANVRPPWISDTSVTNSWQVYDRYMTYSGGSPHVSVWGPQKGPTSFTVSSGTVDVISGGVGNYSSMDAGLFDADALATSLSGTSKPFSVAYLFGTLGAQPNSRHGFACARSTNLISAPLFMRYEGNNSDFKLWRRNDANSLLFGGTFSCANATFYVIDAHFDGTHLNSFQDGSQIDNNLSWDPGGAITSDTFCLGAYHGNTGRVLTSTTRFCAFVFTGGATWSATTKTNVRQYLLRLKKVIR